MDILIKDTTIMWFTLGGFMIGYWVGYFDKMKKEKTNGYDDE